MFETHTFQVGGRYEMRSPGDHDCVWRYTVAKRTAKTVTLVDDQGERLTCRLRVVFDTERCNPFGTYSLCPVLSADKVAR